MTLSKPFAAVALSALLIQSATAQVLPCAPPLDAQLSDSDSARAAGFVQSRTMGLAQAMTAPDADARATVSTIYAEGFAPAQSVADGTYRCRTIKLGGMSPLIVYENFNCAISDGGTAIDKTTGSQRFSGRLSPSNGGFFYQGALHYEDEQPIDYGADPERDQIGCLYEIAGGGRHLLLELPSPQFESTHDLIELVPQ